MTSPAKQEKIKSVVSAELDTIAHLYNKLPVDSLVLKQKLENAYTSLRYVQQDFRAVGFTTESVNQAEKTILDALATLRIVFVSLKENYE
jgi:hypothetical protein